MHTEQQTEQTITAPESAPQPESGESKASKRGGRRPGAGRKANLAKRLLKGFSRNTIAEAVANVDIGAVVTSLLKSKREKTRLETLIFVRDTIIGRPAQNVSLSGGLVHAQYRNMRAMMWGRMKDWLLTGAIDSDPRLECDLTGPGYELDNKVRIQLESKDDMKKRGVDSPDDGDALALTFAQAVAMPRIQPKPQLVYSYPGQDNLRWMM